MEVVVTTEAITCAKPQGYSHHQSTNIHFFSSWMPFLSPNQQCQNPARLNSSKEFGEETSWMKHLHCPELVEGRVDRGNGAGCSAGAGWLQSGQAGDLSLEITAGLCQQWRRSSRRDFRITLCHITCKTWKHRINFITRPPIQPACL